MGRPRKDLADLQLTNSDWVVIKDAGRNKNGKAYLLCQCICGQIREVLKQNLVSGRSSGCGCFSSTIFPFLPRNAGKAVCSTNARKSWNAMFHRCYNKDYDAYPRYGGMGVTVCERWFYLQNFLDDMGDPPKGMTLDRISSFGNYEVGNCRWATRTEQNRNKKRHHYLELDGVKKLLVDWSRELNVSYQLILRRKNEGWSDADALLTPPDPKKQNKKSSHALATR